MRINLKVKNQERETIFICPRKSFGGGNVGRSWRRQLWLRWGSKPQRPSRVPEVAMFDFCYISRSTLGLIDNIGMFQPWKVLLIFDILASAALHFHLRHWPFAIYPFTPTHLVTSIASCQIAVNDTGRLFFSDGPNLPPIPRVGIADSDTPSSGSRQNRKWARHLYPQRTLPCARPSR